LKKQCEALEEKIQEKSVHRTQSEDRSMGYFFEFEKRMKLGLDQKLLFSEGFIYPMDQLPFG
jgi:hypothetical protein